MLDRLLNLFSSSKTSSAWEASVLAASGSKSKSSGGGGQLPPPEEPKVKPKQVGFPGYAKQTVAGTAALPKTDLNLANVDLVSTYRFGASTSDVIRALVRSSPDFSAALSAHLRMGIPERYICPAYDPDGSFNVDATRLCMEILRRIDTMPGYDTGFSNTGSVRSTSEALGKELIIEGAMGMELVLDKARLPSSFAPVPVKPIKFYDDWKQGTKTLRPVQVVGGEEIDLDIPNFFMVWLDPSLLDAYPHPPLESAIQPVLASQQFLNDMRRLLQRHVYPRYDVSIDWEKLDKLIPSEAKMDEKLRSAFISSCFEQVKSAVNNLGVDEAMIHFDFATVKYVEGQDGDVPTTFDTVKEIFDTKIATGAKAMPSMLGHGSGTQNIASTETLIAMLTANSMVRIKVAEMFSKAMTMSARLFGHDVTVRFEFDEIELRPASELEAFKTQRQSRIYQQVSMGYMTDEEACLRTTGNLPPAGMTPKFDTMFMNPAPVEAGADGGNSYSGTGAGGGQSGGGAVTQSRKPGTPTKTRGGQSK